MKPEVDFLATDLTSVRDGVGRVFHDQVDDHDHADDHNDDGDDHNDDGDDHDDHC